MTGHGQVRRIEVGGQDITHLVKSVTGDWDAQHNTDPVVVAVVEPTLFDTDEPTPPAEPAEKLSADRRRTARQRQAIASGLHPLALVVPGVHVHLEVLVGGSTITCGDCKFRQTMGHRSRSYPKCLYGAREVHRVNHEGKGYTATEYPRASHGAGTDIRAGWPACGDFEAAE